MKSEAQRKRKLEAEFLSSVALTAATGLTELFPVKELTEEEIDNAIELAFRSVAAALTSITLNLQRIADAVEDMIP